MVGIFVEHESDNRFENEQESFEESNKDFPSVVEPLNFLGNNEEISREQTDSVGGEGGEPLKMKIDVVDGNVSNESDDGQSVGDDSDISEKFIDSDCQLSDDDAIFDDNIDYEVEWVGNHMAKSDIPTSSGHPSINLTSHLGAEASNNHNGHPIFNQKVDFDDPKFELGMYFEDTASFRKAVRQHSIKQGQLYRTKRTVSKLGSGSDSEQYALLWSYAEEIRQANPGTTVNINFSGANTKSKKRLFELDVNLTVEKKLKGKEIVPTQQSHIQTKTLGLKSKLKVNKPPLDPLKKKKNKPPLVRKSTQVKRKIKACTSGNEGSVPKSKSLPKPNLKHG
ncbi:hypothetical protein DH2020_018585 [Rehmannia glutinosa]|uniref:Uncharacterized protein n=1 Tax=Rehmannia glutinosa TaxID=99300 RepID=A0ABR0WJC0_REHGL